MAVRRIDPNFKKKVVSATDDAIDLVNSSIADYATSLDLDHIKFKEDLHPTYFLISQIDPMSELEINETHQKIIPPSTDSNGKATRATIRYDRQAEACLKYFKHCVKNIEEEGVVKPIDFSQFPLAVLQEIGAFAMLYSQIGQRLKKT